MFRKALLLISLCLAGPLHAFVESQGLDEKSRKADVIVRGVVVEIIPVSVPVADSRGPGSDKVTDENFRGPNALAIVRVTETLKGKPEEVAAVIFVPCGYNFDESPAELTATKEYVLFLEAMGHNYYHPTTPFSMHRLRNGRVGSSGFDTESDFKTDAAPGDTLPYAEFEKQIRQAIAAINPDGKDTK